MLVIRDSRASPKWIPAPFERENWKEESEERQVDDSEGQALGRSDSSVLAFIASLSLDRRYYAYPLSPIPYPLSPLQEALL